MTFFKSLYTRAQEMSAEQILNSKNMANTLSAKEEALKEAWRKDQKALFAEAMQAEDDSTEADLRHKFC